MRAYRDIDLPALQETMAGWIAEAGRCGYDHIGELPHRIYETCSPAEEEMLRAAAETTRALTTGPYLLTDVFDCDTARVDLLRRLGFAHFRTWDDVRERALDGPLSPYVLPAGFVVRSATVADADELAAARNASFTPEWTGALYRDEVMAKPGYDPAREIVVEAPDGRIAAFTVYWVDSRNRTGHFEPVGTHSAFRRLGLARAVMVEAMARMARNGMRTVTVNHNADNVAARRLYEALGFTKRHETHGYRRAVAGR